MCGLYRVTLIKVETLFLRSSFLLSLAGRGKSRHSSSHAWKSLWSDTMIDKKMQRRLWVPRVFALLGSASGSSPAC